MNQVNYGFFKIKFEERFCKKWQNNPSSNSTNFVTNSNNQTFGFKFDLGEQFCNVVFGIPPQ